MHIDCQICPVRDSTDRHCDDCVVRVFLALPRVEPESARAVATAGPLTLDEVECRAVSVLVSCGLVAQSEADTLVAWPARQGPARAVG